MNHMIHVKKKKQIMPTHKIECASSQERLFCNNRRTHLYTERAKYVAHYTRCQTDETTLHLFSIIPYDKKM